MRRGQHFMQRKALIIGACGQIGIELTLALRGILGNASVIASDVKEQCPPLIANGTYVQLSVLDFDRLRQVIIDHHITEVYNMAALLSATSEKNPAFAWELNMNGLLHTLNLAKEGLFQKLFWPSSIAVFGPTTPRIQTPQDTIMDPNSVYGISKLAGERWCEYYAQKHGVDVRSIRYPGLIGYRSAPGGGTTDYAVDIFYKALESGKYECFLGPHTMLPMMMMEDAIRATIDITEAPSDQIKIRSSYNLAGCSFTPEELAQHIRKYIPGFEITYNPDFRQELADSWPDSIDDSRARSDWGWSNAFDTARLTEKMIEEIRMKESNQASIT
jgi:nucleoside-diphosphate-sugar epimerase